MDATRSGLRVGRTAAVAALLALLLAAGMSLTFAPADADARISLAKVKRVNKAHVRDEQCFETCLAWSVRSCQRVGPQRARCEASVQFSMNGQATSCRITNRWRQDGRALLLYRISKRCDPI